MKITLPKGFEFPENAKPGQPFEAVATLVMDESGGVELTAIDGASVGESEEPDEAPEPGEQPATPANPPMAMPWDQENTLE